MKSFKSLCARYASFPGNNSVDRVCYAFYRLLAKLLVKRGVIYSNGISRTDPDRKSALVPATHESCKRIACVTGFGHSGSGAVVDLLSEYDNVSVTGVIDSMDGSLRKSIGEDFEFTLLTWYGGLFSLEDAIADGRSADRESTIKTFLALAAYNYKPNGVILGESFRLATKKFLDEIIDFATPAGDGYDYCHHLKGLGEDGLKIFFGENASMPLFRLKYMDRPTFRRIARNYMAEIITAIPSREILVLDQIVSDLKGDVEKYRDYLGDVKVVAVYRDPRDVYATGLKFGVGWLPKKADEFVNWFRWSVPIERYVSRDNCLLLRFEDLVLNYDESENRIEKFLNLDHGKHINRRKIFNPDISIKNVGLWKTVCGERDDIRYIEKELPQYLYGAKGQI